MIHVEYSTLILCLYLHILMVDNSSDRCVHKYSIVIDGGSSGTRLNVFKFDNDQRSLRINETFTFKSKISLSTFSNSREDWSLMRIMIKGLIDGAIKVIPDNCTEEIPLYLQVTAGIRQMKQPLGSRILNHLRIVLSKSRFHFRNDFVGVLSANEEGQFAWITINFMLENLGQNGDETESTVGILDLGGGSTQIAFATNNPSLVEKSTKIRVLGQEYHIYSNGYDFMGINEARIKYLDAQNQSDSKTKVYRSKCLHPAVETDYNVGDRVLNIAGKIISKDNRFCHCFARALNLTRSVTSIREYFGTKTFVAFSAYYYILKSAGAVFTTNSEGLNQANIRDIILRAIEICENPTLTSNRFSHFLCMDLSYLVALLHNGYGFEWYDEVLSSMKIKGIGLSWALGYAISKL